MSKASTILLAALVFAAISPLPVFAQPSCIDIVGVATVAGSVAITATSFSGVTTGMTVSGPGIASGTTVSAVSLTSITLSAAATATGVVTLTFCLPVTSVPEFGLQATVVAALAMVGVILTRRRALSIR